MISRHWKGTARPGQADAYVDHLETETFPRLAAIPGFVRASILRRPVEAGTEFQIVTVWESLESIEVSRLRPRASHPAPWPRPQRG